jgi:hypothetical protein
VCEETRTHGSEGGGQKDTTRKCFWQVEASNSTSLAPYPTTDQIDVFTTERGVFLLESQQRPGFLFLIAWAFTETTGGNIQNHAGNETMLAHFSYY